MRVDELFHDDLLQEGPLGQKARALATAAAIAGGSIAAGYGLGTASLPKLPAPIVPQNQNQTYTPKDAFNPANLPTASSKFASAFPADLDDQEQRSPEERKADFIRVMTPIINAENARIMVERRFLLTVGNNQTPAAVQRLEYLMQHYHAESLPDLLSRVDIIPTALALAQTAIESGWGTSDMAQKHNEFFGQKIFPGGTGPKGEFASYSSPAAAVAAYMSNINTNDHYAAFRKARMQMRKKGEKLNPVILAKMLTSYDETGKKYTDKVSKLIKNTMVALR